MFPDFNQYQYHVREIFEYFKALIPKSDLLEFAKGKLFRENIINVYFKILEKINLVNLSYYNYQVMQQNSGTADGFNQFQPYKIQYFNTKFFEKLNNDNALKDCQQMLQNFYKYDIAVLPFFIDNENDKRSLVVVVRVATN